jgi:hypothetical protein
MSYKNVVDKSIMLTYPERGLTGFKRRALATKNEILAFMVGDVRWTKTGVLYTKVNEFYYPELHISTPYHVVSKEEPPAGCIGTIHSHPDHNAVGPSPDDIRGAVMDEEYVYGIYTWWARGRKRRMTYMNWYAPEKLVAVRAA